jgi:hypothetical protein
MECLKTLIGLRGGCAEIAADASLFLDSKVKYNELNQFIDQNDYDTVDDMFTSLRSDAVDLVLAEFQTQMQGRYIAKTIIDQQTIGNYSNGLVASAAITKLKGLSLERCTSFPYLGYRVTNVGFIGSYTGNVTVLYYDGLTGVLLGSDTVAAVAGQLVKLNVNRLFNVQDLSIVYDATAIGGYETKVNNYINGCITCNKWRVNKHVTVRPITATIGTPLTKTYVYEMGGLIVDVSMECDNTSWLCGIKQQLAMPMLFKVAELAMEYAITSSSRGNTKTMRDKDSLVARHGLYKNEYETHLKSALNRIVLPNDPICFVCPKRNGVFVSIP